MITKKDVENFLNEIDKYEFLMTKGYKELADQVSDTMLKDTLLRIYKEEGYHDKQVQKLKSLLEEVWKNKS